MPGKGVTLHQLTVALLHTLLAYTQRTADKLSPSNDTGKQMRSLVGQIYLFIIHLFSSIHLRLITCRVMYSS